MKRTFLPLLAVGVMLAMGCSGQNGAENNDATDSVAVQTAEVHETPVNVITGEGIGPLKLGMPIDQIPASVEGLYDSFKKEFVDAMGSKVDESDLDCLNSYQLTFIKDGNTVFECTGDDGDCTHKYVLADFSVSYGSIVKIDINGTQYGCGDDIAELIDNKVITVKGSGPFDKNVYLYNGVEINLKTDNYGNVKKDNRVIQYMRILNADNMTPFPEDYIP